MDRWNWEHGIGRQKERPQVQHLRPFDPVEAPAGDAFILPHAYDCSGAT